MVETYVRLLLITPHSLFRPHFTVSSSVPVVIYILEQSYSLRS
jgi:hypothetical protein